MRSRLVLAEQQALPAITLSAEMAVREIAAVLAHRRLVPVRCCYVPMVAVVALARVLPAMAAAVVAAPLQLVAMLLLLQAQRAVTHLAQPLVH